MRRKWKRRPARGAGTARSVSRYSRVDSTTVARTGVRGKAGPDFAAVNTAALACLPALCARWLPDGFRRGNEWIAKNPMRADQRPGSFSINLVTGRWADFALSDARGGDPISLAAYLASLSQAEATRNLAEMLRVASSPTSTRTRSSIPCHLTSVRGANTVHALARKTNTHRASLFRKTRPTPIGINCDRRKPRRTDQKTPRQWPAPAVAERPRRTPPPSILPRSPTCLRYASDGSRTAGGREAADWVARTRSARTVMPALPRHT